MARRRKTLSQNFLNTPSAVDRFVRLAALGPRDVVVEPGAGEGTLTCALARRCRRVVAYELDPALAARLPARTRRFPNIRTVHGDFTRASPPREPFAVAGNIPFSRSTDIVRWCLQAPAMTSATLLTQWEFACKHTGGYGRWSLLAVRSWPEHEWRLLSRVGRRNFTPVPRTDAAVLRIGHRPAPLLPRDALPAYRAFTAHGFTGVGGSLFATLSRTHRTRRVRAAYTALGMDESLPVGLVPPDRWLALFRALEDAPGAPPTPGRAEP